MHDTGKSLFVGDCVVGPEGLEPPTNRLSATWLCANSDEVATLHAKALPEKFCVSERLPLMVGLNYSHPSYL